MRLLGGKFFQFEICGILAVYEKMRDLIGRICHHQKEGLFIYNVVIPSVGGVGDRAILMARGEENVSVSARLGNQVGHVGTVVVELHFGTDDN